MREILFRGKTEDGKWVFGGYHKWKTRQTCPIGFDELKADEIKTLILVNAFADWNMPRNLQGIEVDPSTVGQYTGLTDKHGTRIFEGDVVQHGYFNRYCREKLTAKYIVMWGKCGFDTALACITEQEFCEVIGNIHDLEVQNENT